jgi:hypothetical protein
MYNDFKFYEDRQMVIIEDVTAAYRTYIDSDRDKDVSEAYFEIIKNFVNEKRNNGLSAEQITDKLFKATWHIADMRTYIVTTCTTSNPISGGCILVYRTPTIMVDLEKSKASFRREIMDYVTDIMGSSTALTLHSLERHKQIYATEQRRSAISPANAAAAIFAGTTVAAAVILGNKITSKL